MTDYGGHGDINLVALAMCGDKAAMRHIYDRYVGYLSAVCSRYIAVESDRKDVLQESFIKIFTSLDKFEYRGEGSLRAWMVRIVVNESLGFLKRSMADNVVEYADRMPDVAEEPDVEGIPDDVVNDMILSLPVGYRTVFNLYVFEQKSHKEIAELLNIGECTSASQFSRAKALLAKRMKEYKSAHNND